MEKEEQVVIHYWLWLPENRAAAGSWVGHWKFVVGNWVGSW